MSQSVKPWTIYRNGNEVAKADSHNQVARIVRQLTKIHPHDKITVRFTGKAISHSGDRGTPL